MKDEAIQYVRDIAEADYNNLMEDSELLTKEDFCSRANRLIAFSDYLDGKAYTYEEYIKDWKSNNQPLIKGSVE